MKKSSFLRLGLIGAIALAGLSLAGCGQPVKQGEVGVKVIEVGGNAGVRNTELGTGRYWNAIGERIIVFPTTTQTFNWTEGAAIRFLNKDGVQTLAPVSVTFRVSPTKASDLVQTYKLGMEDIVNGPLQRYLQNAFVVLGVGYTSEQLYGAGAQQLSADVTEMLRRGRRDAAGRVIQPGLESQGIIIESVNWAGSPVLPQSIVTRINEATAENARAQRARANLATVQATALSVEAAAMGRARAIAVEGQAIRANPEVLRLREIERSRGLCPLSATTCVLGGDVSAMIAN